MGGGSPQRTGAVRWGEMSRRGVSRRVDRLREGGDQGIRNDRTGREHLNERVTPVDGEREADTIFLCHGDAHRSGDTLARIEHEYIVRVDSHVWLPCERSGLPCRDNNIAHAMKLH